MHTLEFMYDEYDLRYSKQEGVPENSPIWAYFHYNSDLSGEVIIALRTHHEDDAEVDLATNDVLKQLGEIRIPAWMLVEFVGRHLINKRIASLEDMTGREFLAEESSDG